MAGKIKLKKRSTNMRNQYPKLHLKEKSQYNFIKICNRKQSLKNLLFSHSGGNNLLKHFKICIKQKFSIHS